MNSFKDFGKYGYKDYSYPYQCQTIENLLQPKNADVMLPWERKMYSNYTENALDKIHKLASKFMRDYGVSPNAVFISRNLGIPCGYLCGLKIYLTDKNEIEVGLIMSEGYKAPRKSEIDSILSKFKQNSPKCKEKDLEWVKDYGIHLNSISESGSEILQDILLYYENKLNFTLYDCQFEKDGFKFYAEFDGMNEHDLEDFKKIEATLSNDTNK